MMTYKKSDSIGIPAPRIGIVACIVSAFVAAAVVLRRKHVHLDSDVILADTK